MAISKGRERFGHNGRGRPGSGPGLDQGPDRDIPCLRHERAGSASGPGQPAGLSDRYQTIAGDQGPGRGDGGVLKHSLILLYEIMFNSIYLI